MTQLFFFRALRRIDRLHAVAGCFALLIVLAVSPRTAAAQDFNVTTVSGDMANYHINGQLDPVLNLVRGHTYTFAVTTPGHPFYIKTAQVTGTGSQYTTGVTNNGAESGTLTFVVPASAPNQLFYQCSVHSAMTAAINITSPVPSGDAGAAALLVLLLLGAGIWRARLPTPGARA